MKKILPMDKKNNFKNREWIKLLIDIMGTYYSYLCGIDKELRKYLVSHKKNIIFLLYREPITGKHMGKNH